MLRAVLALVFLAPLRAAALPSRIVLSGHMAAASSAWRWCWCGTAQHVRRLLGIVGQPAIVLDDEGVVAGVVSSTRALHEGAGRRRLAGIIGGATPASTGRTSTNFHARSSAQHGHGRSRPLTRPIVAHH